MGIYILLSLLRSCNSLATSVLGTSALEQNLLKEINGSCYFFSCGFVCRFCHCYIAALEDAGLKSSAILPGLKKAKIECTKLSSRIACSFMGQFSLLFNILFAHQVF